MSAPLVIATAADVRTLFAHLADRPDEVVGFGYLDPEWRLLGVRHSPSGGAGAAAVPIRAVARDAVLLAAAWVVMAHNHPSGDPAPSRADLAVTRRLARALAALGAPLIEHVILTRTGSTSLRETGRL